MKLRTLFPLIAILWALFAVGCGTKLIGNSSPENSGGTDSSGARKSEATVHGKKAESLKPTSASDTRSTSSAKVSATGSSSESAAHPRSRTKDGSSTTGTRTSSAHAGSTTAALTPDAEQTKAPFIDSPQASGGTGSEADSILAVRYGVHKSYERMVVDLGAGRMPAKSVPEWTLNSPTGDGLLRVTFPSVSATRTSDRDLGGMLRDFHVARAPEGGMFIDMVSESAFIYRVTELSDPARLVVDFKASPSGAQLQMQPPTEAGNTVLVEPRAGSSVGDPLIVSGYSRNPEATNTIILKGPDGETLIRDTVQSNDWSSTWGYFETTLAPPPFSGEATLMVGTESPRNGSFQGVEVPINGS